MEGTREVGEYAVGWFTLSLINAGLAQSKGRSGASWWLVSLFVGPLATLGIVLLRPVDRTRGESKGFDLRDFRQQ